MDIEHLIGKFVEIYVEMGKVDVFLEGTLRYYPNIKYYAVEARDKVGAVSFLAEHVNYLDDDGFTIHIIMPD